jgi:hypothetical protein
MQMGWASSITPEMASSRRFSCRNDGSGSIQYTCALSAVVGDQEMNEEDQSPLRLHRKSVASEE